MKPKAHVSDVKKKAVSELVELGKSHRTILLCSIKNIPGSQFQEIVKKLRGKAVVKVPKKSLILRALDDDKSEGVVKLKETLDDSFAILFSDLDAFELAGELMKSQSPAKAKSGQEAPEDITIEAGPTELVPGPAISELGAVGLQVQVENGKLTIKESKVIVKKGEKIKTNAADIMAKLDIKPFKIGFIPLCALDKETGTFFAEVKIDTEGTLTDLKYAFGKALPFAVSIGYMSKDTIGLMLQKAETGAKKINRIFTGEPEPEVIAPAGEDGKEEEKPKEETKSEEPKVDAAAGLAGLFG